MSEALRQEIAHLEEQVAYWKGLAGSPDEPAETAFWSYGLTRREAEILAALYKRPSYITNEALFALIWGGDSETDSEVIKTMICLIRRRIGKNTILTIWGVGYQLSEAGRAACDRMLSEPPPPRRQSIRHGREEGLAVHG